jgi:tetratricopeptide (TPR) repeat protein
MRNWRRDTEGNVIAAARAYYEQSIAADPNYAPAILGLAASYYSAWIEPAFDEAIAPEYRQKPILDRALFLAQRSVELDGSLAEARTMLAWVLHWQHRRAESMVEYKRAFELNPNLADPRFGHVLSQSGRNLEAVEYLERSMRLDPFHSDIFYVFLGSAYYLVGRYEEAGGLLRRGAQTIPSYRPISIWRSATAAQLGRLEEAEDAARHLLHLNPKFTISWFLEYNRYAQEDADRLTDGLRKAGLPE